MFFTISIRPIRFFLSLLVLLALVGIFIQPAFAQEKQPIRAALAFGSISTEDDKSFLSAVKSGARKAVEEFNIELDAYERNDAETEESFLASVAERNIDVLIAINFPDATTLMKTAENHPNVKLMAIDTIIPPMFPNAKSIIFREHEGCFLVGMIAALKSENGKIGFIGGRFSTLIRNFAHGYKQGAMHVAPDIEIVENMIGTTSDAWSNPDKARELAERQLSQGVDVIFAAAGNSGMTVLQTVAAHEKLAIGVDTNQNGLFPGHVLTSMVKKVDIAVYEALKEVHDGEWDPGILNLGLREKALDYAVDVHNRDLLDEALISEVETAQSQILRGSLKVNIYTPERKEAE